VSIVLGVAPTLQRALAALHSFSVARCGVRWTWSWHRPNSEHWGRSDGRRQSVL